eukprot:3576924-Alexandrium_andersonii.AAC.2
MLLQHGQRDQIARTDRHWCCAREQGSPDPEAGQHGQRLPEGVGGRVTPEALEAVQVLRVGVTEP